jgi:dephospho-CoA kinase
VKLCGLTGGVGMGKSTAASILGTRGARIVDTDRLAHELVQPGQPALAEIQNTFGKEVVSPDGSLRRSELANIVFSNSVSRKQLERILHPRIRERWVAQIESWRKENCPLAVVVIPLLYETEAESFFDKIICVACTDNSRFERLRARGWTPEQIKGRIAAQMPVTEKIARADFVIWTEGDLQNHSRQVDAILGRISGN